MTPEHETIPFKRNQVLHVLDGSSYLVFMSMCSVGVIMPAFVKRYSGDAFLLALIPLLFDLLAALPQPWFAYRIRRERARPGGYSPVKRYFAMVVLNRVWFIPFGIALFFLGGYPAAALIAFYSALALFSVFLSAASPCWIDLLSLTIPDSIRPGFMGKREMLSRIVGIASSFLVPVFLAVGAFPSNYALLFLVAGLVMVAGILPSPAYAALYPMAERAAGPIESFASFAKQGFTALFGNKRVRPFLVMFWGYSMARIGNAFFAPYIIDEVLSAYPQDRAALLLSILNMTNLLGMAVAAYASGRVIQRFGNKANLLIGAITIVAAYLAILLWHTFAAAWIGMALLSYYAVAGSQSAINGLMDSAPPEARSILTSFNAFINAFFMMGFYFGGSRIAGKWGYGAALAFSAVAMGALALGSAFYLIRTGKAKA
jgi:predicted MFS family arabinose efflux permease